MEEHIRAGVKSLLQTRGYEEGLVWTPTGAARYPCGRRRAACRPGLVGLRRRGGGRAHQGQAGRMSFSGQTDSAPAGGQGAALPAGAQRGVYFDQGVRTSKGRPRRRSRPGPRPWAGAVPSTSPWRNKSAVLPNGISTSSPRPRTAACVPAAPVLPSAWRARLRRARRGRDVPAPRRTRRPGRPAAAPRPSTPSNRAAQPVRGGRGRGHGREAGGGRRVSSRISALGVSCGVSLFFILYSICCGFLSLEKHPSEILF